MADWKMIEIDRASIVAQANALIEARYESTIKEEIFLKAMMSTIKPSDQDFMKCSGDVYDLADKLGMSRSNAVREFDRITTNLMSSVIKIKTPNGWKKFQWVSESELNGNIISFRFHDGLKAYLLALNKTGHFTQYRLENIISFRHACTAKISELLIKNHNQKKKSFDFSVVDLKKKLFGDNTKKYPLFKDFKRYALTLAQDELSEKEESGEFRHYLNFELETYRTGRSITDLRFLIVEQTNKEKKVSNNSEEDQKTIFDFLITFEVGEKISREISQKYSIEYVKEKVNLLEKEKKKRKIPKPDGWLIKAIKEDYKDKGVIEQEEVKRVNQIAKDKADTEAEKRRLESKKIAIGVKFRNNKVDEFLANNSNKENALSFLRKAAAENPAIAVYLLDLDSSQAKNTIIKIIPNYETEKEKYIQENL